MAGKVLGAWLVNVAALYIATWALPHVTYGDQWWTLLAAAAVFTLVNLVLKPVLTFLAIPFIIVTLGIAYFLINVLMLYVTDWVVPDFEITAFGSAVIAAVVVAIVNWVLGALIRRG
jgi:putative membrane protein